MPRFFKRRSKRDQGRKGTGLGTCPYCQRHRNIKFFSYQVSVLNGLTTCQCGHQGIIRI